MESNQGGHEPPDDPVYISSRREAIVAFVAWFVLGVVTVTISVSLGYDIDPATMSTFLGIPTWIVLGVIVPWICAIVFAVWFSLFFVKDEDLGSEPEEGADGE